MREPEKRTCSSGWLSTLAAGGGCVGARNAAPSSGFLAALCAVLPVWLGMVPQAGIRRSVPAALPSHRSQRRTEQTATGSTATGAHLCTRGLVAALWARLPEAQERVAVGRRGKGAGWSHASQPHKRAARCPLPSLPTRWHEQLQCCGSECTEELTMCTAAGPPAGSASRSAPCATCAPSRLPGRPAR